MSGGMEMGTCDECGFETVNVWESGEHGCDHTFCMSLFCGSYRMENDNPKHPDYSKNGFGNHSKEEVCELREMFSLSYGNR